MKVLLCGSGELGRELTLELQKLGVYVVAMDSYENAPAMQVADSFFVCNMLNEKDLQNAIDTIKPDFIVPEVEAIATNVLLKAEQNDITVIPNAQSVIITMNREKIRRLASEKLHLLTSKYKFAKNIKELKQSISILGLPCIIKPIMSSSGKGQSLIRTHDDIQDAWDKAQQEGRAGKGTVIVEEVINFDYELTLLTVRSKNGVQFCSPIGHRQIDGDYIESWQPHPCNEIVLEKAQNIAKSVVNELGGYGIFGVELFVKGNNVYFSEASPRPHDTGLVTLITQNMSEFQLHARALLGMNVPEIELYSKGASRALKVSGFTDDLQVSCSNNVIEDTDIRLFGKKKVSGKRRVGVLLAKHKSIEEARNMTRFLLDKVYIEDDSIHKII